MSGISLQQKQGQAWGLESARRASVYFVLIVTASTHNLLWTRTLYPWSDVYLSSSACLLNVIACRGHNHIGTEFSKCEGQTSWIYDDVIWSVGIHLRLHYRGFWVCWCLYIWTPVLVVVLRRIHNNLLCWCCAVILSCVCEFSSQHRNLGIPDINYATCIYLHQKAWSLQRWCSRWRT